jgi:PqqD family protein of HPr-rel-A system
MARSDSTTTAAGTASPRWYERRSELPVPARRDEVTMELLDDQAVLYDPQTGTTLRLNETALAVWRACDGRTSLRSIAETLGRDYDVDFDRALDDVEQVVCLLTQHGLLAA